MPAGNMHVVKVVADCPFYNLLYKEIAASHNMAEITQALNSNVHILRQHAQ